MKKYLLIAAALFVCGFISGTIMYLNHISIGENVLLVSSGLISMFLIPMWGLSILRNSQNKLEKIHGLHTALLLIFANISICFTILNYSSKESVYWVVIAIFVLYATITIAKLIKTKAENSEWMQLVINSMLLSVLGVFVFNVVNKEQISNLYALETESQKSFEIQKHNTLYWYKNIQILKNESPIDAAEYYLNAEKINNSTIAINNYIDSVKQLSYNSVKKENDSLSVLTNLNEIQKIHDLFCGYINNQKDTIRGIGNELKNKLIDYRTKVKETSLLGNEMLLPLDILGDTLNLEKAMLIDPWVYKQFANKMLIQEVLLLTKFQNEILYIENLAIRNLYTKAWVAVNNKKKNSSETQK